MQTHYPHNPMYQLLLIIKQNSEAICSAIVANLLLLFSIKLPEMSLFPLFILSIGNYLQDIQAIVAIFAGIVSILTAIKVTLDIKEKFKKSKRK